MLSWDFLVKQPVSDAVQYSDMDSRACRQIVSIAVTTYANAVTGK